MTGFTSARAQGDHGSGASNRRKFYAALAIGGLVCAGGVARAQDVGTSQLTITTPSGLGAMPGPRIGPVQDVALSAPVVYGDLDIGTPGGAQVLRLRIADAAQSLCTQMDFLYPIGVPDHATCTRNAIQEAMEEVYGAGGAPG